ncbi:MAG: tyrosine-type recombinase/integrase [Opitutales bacterium]
MVKLGRIPANPLAHVSKADLRGKQQRRRALTEDELQRLLNASGPRRLLYTMACYTGFRQNELRQLCWGDLHLDGDRPHVRARASTTKNGKDALIPLHPELASELKAAQPTGAKEGERVFYIDTHPDRTFVRDLKNAKVERFDGLGRKVDFHALRYTFCTMLAREGTSQRMAQELMRHSDPHLTAQIYTDISQLPTFDVVSKLPWSTPDKEGDDPQIDPQNLFIDRHEVSQFGSEAVGGSVEQIPDDQGLMQDFSQLVASGHMARAEGFEPPTARLEI